jgi:hypothetical protein
MIIDIKLISSKKSEFNIKEWEDLWMQHDLKEYFLHMRGDGAGPLNIVFDPEKQMAAVADDVKIFVMVPNC